MRSCLIIFLTHAVMFTAAYAEQVAETAPQLVDELLVFTDKEQFAKDLTIYHRKLIVPAVAQYYAKTPLASDPKVIEIATDVIDVTVARAVNDQLMVEQANREYYLAKLNGEELRAIVNILNLPNGKKILLNFSEYLSGAKALRVTKGRAMRDSIEQEILSRVTEYQESLSATATPQR